MAVKIDTRRLRKRFEQLQKNLNSANDRKALGKFVIDTIVERTRGKGKGVNSPGGAQVKLRKVTKKWADRRKKFSRHPKAATGTNSNLTFQGTLLDQLALLKATKSEIIIGYRSSKQEKKAEGQAAQGRKFLFLSRGEIADAAKFVRNNILKNV